MRMSLSINNTKFHHFKALRVLIDIGGCGRRNAYMALVSGCVRYGRFNVLHETLISRLRHPLTNDTFELLNIGATLNHNITPVLSEMRKLS